MEIKLAFIRNLVFVGNKSIMAKGKSAHCNTTVISIVSFYVMRQQYCRKPQQYSEIRDKPALSADQSETQVSHASLQQSGHAH